MERIVYDRMAELDSRHWWYRARREVLARLIERRLDLPADARILEIGCGTGHNLPMLGRFGAVDGIEIDEQAREIAGARLGRPVGLAPLPELPGVADASYDLVALLDVIEHVADDEAALRSVARKLKPGGKILITVPAHPWMWSAHDVANHHFRRYTRNGLRDLIRRSGLKVELLGYFNSILFPLAVAARLLGRLTGREGSDDALPPAPLNRSFEFLFGLEAHLVGRIYLPPGLSLFSVVSTT
jgi:SAM-dependent methyltransferase